MQTSIKPSHGLLDAYGYWSIYTRLHVFRELGIYVLAEASGYRLYMGLRIFLGDNPPLGVMGAPST